MSHRQIIPVIVFLLSLLLVSPLQSAELKDWPRSVAVSAGSITIYQPQIESLENNILKGRAAIAYFDKEKNNPVFGVAWFTSRVEIDRDKRIVHYETLDITDTRFPEGDAKLGDEFIQAVQDGMKSWMLHSSLDELTTALAALSQEKKETANLKNDPPDILYMDKPALLVTIDGKEILKKLEKSPYEAVANTPYPLFFESKSGNWYLNAADKVWYQSKKLDGPWVFDNKPPADLAEMVQNKAKEYAGDKDKQSKKEVTAGNAPAIVVVHKPTELIVSTGQAQFQPLTDDLLAMSNTNSNVFMDVKSQNYYLVISGRWYKATSMTGHWSFVASDKLPSYFTKIPKDSKYADIRVYVAGTDEAKEAVMDAQIPQTASVKRGTVEIKLTYDGKPEFKKISGTDLKFAVNCSETVIEAGKDYYLVKDAVWYIAKSATGPWQVSDHAPPGIANIPPSSPIYNTKYVYVYGSTPDVVYVGYTPGYVGSYIYGPTIVYGTGWHYDPWISPYYYYPYPVTWGFGVAYSPWYGWGFGMSWSSGPFMFGFYSGGYYHGYGYHGYWGPRGYRPRYTNLNININNNININRNQRESFTRNNNLYRNKSQRANIANTVDSHSISSRKPNRISSDELNGADIRNKTNSRDNLNQRNNVLADENGNIFRHQDGQWQQHTSNQWKDRSVPEASNIGKRAGYDHPSSIDRQQFSRQRSSQRAYQYHGRAGGMHGGGGGRFRR